MLITFVKENADVIRSRQSYAKVCLLLDWDSAGKVPSLQALFKSSEPFLAMAWEVKEANQNLFYIQNCKGVERFYPDSILLAAKEARPELFFTNTAGTTMVKKDEIAALKKLLNDQVNKGLTESDAVYAKPLVQRLLTSLK